MLTKKLFLIRPIGTTYFGMIPPQKQKPFSTEVIVTTPFLTEGECEDVKKAETGQLYDSDRIFPATPQETLEYYKNLHLEELSQFQCYWFFIQNEGNDGSIITKDGCLPVYHFGIKKFFSGRVGFDWSKNGGTVYKIK